MKRNETHLIRCYMKELNPSFIQNYRCEHGIVNNSYGFQNNPFDAYIRYICDEKRYFKFSRMKWNK